MYLTNFESEINVLGYIEKKCDLHLISHPNMRLYSGKFG